MTYQLFQLPRAALANSLELKPGWTVSFFLTTTTTPTPVYTTSALSTTHTQPVEADAGGLLPAIYLDSTIVYKASVYDENDVLQYTQDPVNDSILSQSVIGGLLYPVVSGGPEQTAGVTPVRGWLPYLDPGRYGAVGDGITDDTAAMNNWIAVVNATTRPVSTWPYTNNSYLCDPLDEITVADFTLNANGGRIVAAPDSWTGEPTHFLVRGARANLRNLVIDGNQDDWNSSAVGYLLQFGDDIDLYNVTVKESPGYGAANILNGQRCKMVNSHFDDNASVGLSLNAQRYGTFSGCTFERNGYGFQGAYDLNAQGGGFGLAIRYRSHHLTFTRCRSKLNGRDGMNVNQGSYAIKFIGCESLGDNDGGFTVANDNTSTGLPGESESPRDLEYIDCEAGNAYNSGLAVYCAVYGLQVRGGRYYNNHRNAGLIADGASFNYGVFVASGSLMVDIDTAAYDDRQICPITAASGTSPRTLTATGWVSGSAGSYPRVALYNASMAFQGWGTISSESSGSVVITTTADTGVTLASIASGWFVSQRTQRGGVLLNNGCQGIAKVMPGPLAPFTTFYPPLALTSSWTDDGQNVLTPDYTLDSYEMLVNPSFDADVANWTSSNATLSQETVTPVLSAGVLQIDATGANAYAQAGLQSDYISRVSAYCFVEASVNVYSSLQNVCALRLYWDIGGGTYKSTIVYHPGGGYRRLTIGAFMNAPAAILYRIEVDNGVTVYADDASLKRRFIPMQGYEYTFPTRNLPLT